MQSTLPCLICIAVQMVDDVMSIQNGLLAAHNLSTGTSNGFKPSGQPHVVPFDLNTSPIPANSPQSNSMTSESPRRLLDW